MRLSELYEVIAPASVTPEFQVFLAGPDPTPGDDLDVQLVEIGDIQVDYDRSEIRFIPASANIDKPLERNFSTLGLLLSELPFEARDEDDMRLMVELPLLREDSDNATASLDELRDAHVGLDSGEVWLLAKPVEEFPVGSLPD